MGYVVHPSRREFIALAGVLALGANRNESRWALLADTHIAENPAESYRGFRPNDNLPRVVEAVQQAKVSGVLIAGDLARLEGRPGDYENLAKILQPLTSQLVVGFALGNHDHRDNFLGRFQQLPGERQPVAGKLVSSIDAGPVKFVLLDSLIQANYTPGLLGKAQRDWLQRYLLKETSKPIVLVVHHTLDDRDTALLDVLWLYRIIEPLQVVKAILYGHSHAWSVQEHAGIHLINLPATGYNFNDNEPVGWVEAEFTASGAAFQLHAVGGNRSRDGETVSLRWRA